MIIGKFTNNGEGGYIVNLTRGVFARCPAKVRTKIAGMGKACWIIDTGHIGQRDNGADARH